MLRQSVLSLVAFVYLVLVVPLDAGVATETSWQDPRLLGTSRSTSHFDNVSQIFQTYNLNTFAHWDDVTALSEFEDDGNCIGENPALGTCGVRGWKVNGRKNYQNCLTGWIKQGHTTIPSCGERQLCMIAGFKRTIPGKPISCRIFSQMQLRKDRQWTAEVGEGTECKFACFNSLGLKDYSVSREWFIGENSTSPMCFPDTMYLTGKNSDCSISRQDGTWKVEGQPERSSECSSRCYDKRWAYMDGLETIDYTGKLRDAYEVCFISYAHQETSTNVSCQLSMRNNDWWFEREGEGLACKATCSCNDSSGYCQRL